jgi:hypothetical protein
MTTVLLVALVLALDARPADAQVDLSGMWAPVFHEDQVERIPGPDVGDYAGLPITEAARVRALAWSASILTFPEHQCKPYPSTYGFRGVGNLRIWPEFDDQTERLVKLNTHIQWQEQRREIWLDGRPHPPEWAAHTWQGFSTGRWEGSVLVVQTTHLKAGWMRRNTSLATSARTRPTPRSSSPTKASSLGCLQPIHDDRSSMRRVRPARAHCRDTRWPNGNGAEDGEARTRRAATRRSWRRSSGPRWTRRCRSGARREPQGGDDQLASGMAAPERGALQRGNYVDRTEHFDRFAAPNGEWIVITSIVADPMYLTGEPVTSTHFKRERDGAKWSPSPCRTS